MDNFFVGYKAIPPTLKKLYLFIVAVALLLSAVTSYSISSHQKHAGHGVWDTTEKVTFEGLLTVDPYPMLHRPTANNQTESIMLVTIGKHSAEALASTHAGKMVSVTGYTISLGGWLMLELDGDDAVQPSTDQQAAEDAHAQAQRTSLGKVSLTGEIMDSKCFLGVMKPGSGPVHKACAELCLLGGIPPMLVVEDLQSRKFGYLLTQADGTSASTLLAPMAAESVEINGDLEQQGDMLYIRLSSNDIKLHEAR